MPSELPEPKPKQSEKVKVEEDQESPEEKNEKTYTPPNKLGLPVAKFLPQDLLQNAVQHHALAGSVSIKQSLRRLISQNQAGIGASCLSRQQTHNPR